MAELPRRVEVVHEGFWYEGWVEAVRRDEAGWWGFVCYTVAPGRRYLQWRPQEQLRTSP